MASHDAVNDSDDEGHLSQWVWDRWFEGETECGYRIKYNIACRVEKIDPVAFRKSGMNQRENRDAFVEYLHNSIFLPAWKNGRYFFGLLDDYEEQDALRICRYAEIEGEDWFALDPEALDLKGAVGRSLVKKNGCCGEFLTIELKIDEKLAKENFEMIKIRRAGGAKTTDDFRQAEEAVVIAKHHAFWEAQRALQGAQVEQHHEAISMSVRTEQAGQGLSLEWSMPGDGHRIRGYRTENGFPEGFESDELGRLVVDATRRGKSVQHLAEGKEYFFTFILTREDPVFRNETVLDTVRSAVGKPAIAGVKETPQDLIRFSVRIPTQAELIRVDQKLQQLTERKAAPVNQQLQDSLKYLMELRAFEETLRTFEASETERINDSNDSDAVKQERIARLKDQINNLLVQG